MYMDGKETIAMNPAPSFAPDQPMEPIAAVTQETKAIAHEALDMLNIMIFNITAIEQATPERGESKCLCTDILQNRALVKLIVERIKVLKDITGC